jgi:uncharacterized protein YbjQ (UPF0145 family)
MNVPLLVSGTLVIGAVIGWVLANEINGLLWKRLVEIQRETADAQRNAITLQRNVIALSQDLKEKNGRIEQEWKNVFLANEEALKNMREANDMLEASRREKEESNKMLQEAVSILERTQRKS